MSSTDKLSYGLIGLFVFLHLVLISSFGISADAAHYGMYALNPALSYFDHPPIVGWILIPSQYFFPGIESLRLTTILFMTINSLLLLRLAKQLYPNSELTPVFTLALFYLSLITQLLGWGMVPDVPLMTWNLLIVLSALKLKQAFSLKEFILFGIWVGLAGLTKYTAIVIPVALMIWLALEKQLVSWLKQPGLWIAVVIAALMLIPVIVWNIENDWISFAYQFDHGAAGEWKISNALRMQVAQFAAYAPLAYVLGIVVMVAALLGVLKSRTEFTSGQRLVFVMAMLHLGLVAWSSGNGELLPHWGALGWLLMAPLAANKLLQLWREKGKFAKVSLSALGGLSVLLWALLFVLLAFKPVASIKGSEGAFQDLMGWQEAADRAVELASQYGTEYLWVDNWSYTSRVAWYSRNSGTTIQVVDGKPNQFDLWNGEPEASTTAILVTPVKHKKDKPKEIELAGSQCEWLENLDHKYDGVRINLFNFYLCGPESK
jgi:4-amino-4-deoxy-L-arabinose transferase-like glycosyltransferase